VKPARQSLCGRENDADDLEEDTKVEGVSPGMPILNGS
jgi:hypothetical protein